MNVLLKPEEVVDEFSSESDSEIDKLMIHAVINSIEDSNKPWICLGGSRTNTVDSSKESLVQSRRKKSTPVKRNVIEAFDRDNNFRENDCGYVCDVKQKYENESQEKAKERLKGAKQEIILTKTCLEKPKAIHTVNSSDGLQTKLEAIKTKGKSVLSNFKWHCTRCPAVLNTMCELKTHHNNGHNQSVVFKCLQCPKVYSRYQSFVRHVKLHSASRTYECEVCHKSFTQKTVLLAHATVHSNNRPHMCKVCGKTFKQFSSLYCHNKNHFPVKSKFQCLVCDKAYATKHTLELHRKIHSGERNFICDVCGKSFIARGSLDYHILSHTDAKPHVCHCGKGFKTARLLEKHSTLHTGVKPHRCDYCGKQFREKGALKEHTRIHTGVMPYTCEFCGRMFRFKGILTVHRRQHTGERPYGCTDCKKTFTNWANYNKHMKRRHKNEYNPTNVSGRNKYKPPFLIQDKLNSVNNSSGYQKNTTDEEINNKRTEKLNEPEPEEDMARNYIIDPRKNLESQENVRNYCEQQDLSIVSHHGFGQLFGAKEDIEEALIKLNEPLNIFNVANRGPNIRIQEKEADEFPKMVTAQNSKTPNFQIHPFPYNILDLQNNKVQFSEFNKETRFIEDVYNSVSSSNMVCCVPIHCDIPLGLNSSKS